MARALSLSSKIRAYVSTENEKFTLRSLLLHAASGPRTWIPMAHEGAHSLAEAQVSSSPPPLLKVCIICQFRNYFPAIIAWLLQASQKLLSLFYFCIQDNLFPLHSYAGKCALEDSLLQTSMRFITAPFSAREPSALPLCRRKRSCLDYYFSVVAAFLLTCNIYCLLRNTPLKSICTLHSVYRRCNFRWIL